VELLSKMRKQVAAPPPAVTRCFDNIEPEGKPKPAVAIGISRSCGPTSHRRLPRTHVIGAELETAQLRFMTAFSSRLLDREKRA
jgi:hypothetical protein